MKRILFIIILFTSCQEEISLELNQAREKLVVEGSIEPGFPPYVILTKNQGYFSKIDTNTYSNLFVKDAIITVSYTENNVTEVIELTTEVTDLLGSDTIVIYTVKLDEYDFINGLDNYNFSKIGRTYNLNIYWRGDSITAQTTIPEPTPLDSIWVEKSEFGEFDFESEIRAWYSDPAGIQNNLLTKTKLVSYSENDSLECKSIDKEDFFLQLLDCGTDILIDGESFEFPIPKLDNGFPIGNYRATHYSECENGDSVLINKEIVLIKFCQINEESMRFWRGVVRQAGFNSNPFTEPLNLPSNIDGGLGVWTGFSPTYYKIPIVQDTTIFYQYDPKFEDIL